MPETVEATTKATGNASDRAPKLSKEIPITTLTTEEIEDRLIKARIEMLISAPFFGNLATRLRFKDATEWCPTAATDGKYFYYNRNFIAALSDVLKCIRLADEACVLIKHFRCCHGMWGICHRIVCHSLRGEVLDRYK